MKVEIDKKPIGWQPKTLNITFETEEEVLMFVEMLAFDVSIPELVYPTEGKQRTNLEVMMLKIQETLTKDM